MATYTFIGKDGKPITLNGVKSGWNSTSIGAGIGSGAGAGALTGLGPDPVTSALFGAAVGSLAGSGDGYKTNNLFRRGTAEQLNTLIEFVAINGYYPSDSEIDTILGGVSKGALRNLKEDLHTFLDSNDVAYGADKKSAVDYSSVAESNKNVYNPNTSIGVEFDPRKGGAKGADLKYPVLTGDYSSYRAPAHDMVTLKDKEIEDLIAETNSKGRPLTKEEVLLRTGKTNGDNKYAYYATLVDENKSIFGFNAAGTTFNSDGLPIKVSESDKNTYDTYAPEESDVTSLEANYKENAMDKYWNDIYSLGNGTLGADMLNRLTTAEQNAALSNMQLADAQYQQASMQQAQVVKNITDQVRSERMAKLRAGMSESQIANQDMQVMLNNMNTMNQQMNTMNQNKLAAQQQYGLAQDTAYQQYLQNAQVMAQSGAALSAANAGDPSYQAQLYSQQTGVPYATAYKIVTGQNNTQTK